MNIKWNKIPITPNTIRSPLYYANVTKCKIELFINIAFDKNRMYYSLHIYDKNDFKRAINIRDIPMCIYDDTSILVFAHEVVEHLEVLAYGYL